MHALVTLLGEETALCRGHAPQPGDDAPRFDHDPHPLPPLGGDMGRSFARRRRRHHRSDRHSPRRRDTPATITYSWARGAARTYVASENGIGAMRQVAFTIKGENVKLANGSTRILVR